MFQPDLSKLHGLIIGIDDYKHPKQHLPLGGCVSDATAILDYLTKDLKVPENQLLCLLDGKATRKEIINSFQRHLVENKGINHSDPIVIYFAGYGTRQKAPSEWCSGPNDGMTELILPYDAGLEKGSYHLEDEYTHGIPGRTLGALIHRLSQVKGDNITVILDCCFSGSGTGGCVRERYSYDPDAPPAPFTLDEDLVGMLSPVPSTQAQQATIVKGMSCNLSVPSEAPSPETHILLAACKGGERAQEVPQVDRIATQPRHASSGSFTTALLKTLRESDLATTSYAALTRAVQTQMISQMSRLAREDDMGVGLQTPQCEGRKQDTLLFRKQFALCKGMIPLEPGQWEGTFSIKAGSASGIQVGTELGVYSGNMSTKSPPLARLVAAQITAIDATLCVRGTDSVLELPQDAYVVVVKYTGHAVRILKHDETKLPQHWEHAFRRIEFSIDIVWSKPGEPSDLVLVSTERGVLLQRQDPYVIQLEPRDILLEHKLLAEDLAQKLGAIAHFHFHLQRRNPDSPLEDRTGAKLFGMKLIELKDIGRSYDWAPEEYVPVSEELEDLFGDSASTGKVARIQTRPEKRYGLQLTNNSQWPLFAWVIYFDLEDYSISFLYDPPYRPAKPPLSINQPLAVGYEYNGTDPLQFQNSGYSSRESGVFMLFVSNNWLGISHMEQPSIFEPRVDEVRGEVLGRRVNPGSSIWDVLVVGVAISEQAD
ncbi:hypothetical protein FRC10_008928 [Ceratobasidium sp. 414]|nr:hypothetical protein FRC10_008928 [Ceratobasidium sp. 414]